MLLTLCSWMLCFLTVCLGRFWFPFISCRELCANSSHCLEVNYCVHVGTDSSLRMFRILCPLYVGNCFCICMLSNKASNWKIHVLCFLFFEIILYGYSLTLEHWPQAFHIDTLLSGMCHWLFLQIIVHKCTSTYFSNLVRNLMCIDSTMTKSCYPWSHWR